MASSQQQQSILAPRTFNFNKERKVQQQVGQITVAHATSGNGVISTGAMRNAGNYVQSTSNGLRHAGNLTEEETKKLILADGKKKEVMDDVVKSSHTRIDRASAAMKNVIDVEAARCKARTTAYAEKVFTTGQAKSTVLTKGMAAMSLLDNADTKAAFGQYLEQRATQQKSTAPNRARPSTPARGGARSNTPARQTRKGRRDDELL